MTFALLGIPNLGLIAWLILGVVLACDIGVCLLGWKAASVRQCRELDERLARFRPGPRVIGGSAGPHIEHPKGKEVL